MKSRAAESKVKEQPTIKVSVEVVSWLKEDFGHDGWDRLAFDQEIPRSSTLMGLLQQLGKEYPKFRQKAFAEAGRNLLDYSAVVHNDTFLSSLQDLDIELKEGDEIKLAPGFYGG